jgi:hypothetical protein
MDVTKAQADGYPESQGSVLAQLDELACRLGDLGQAAAEGRVREAARLAGKDPDAAAEILRSLVPEVLQLENPERLSD